MNIFIGSSREATDVMDWIAESLERLGHKPLRWEEPGLFPPGENTFFRLIEISKMVEGAIFIFAEDDKVWYRGDGAYQTRDNVLIEYGLFVGRLGPGKAVIAMYKTPKQAADLHGITYVDVSDNRRERARVELRIWASNLHSEKVDPVTLQLRAKVAEQDKKVQALEQRLSFQDDKTDELEKLLRKKGVVNLREYDLEKDGHWKLLFDYDYFWPVSLEIGRQFATLDNLRNAFSSTGAKPILDMIAWDIGGEDRTAFMARKILRLIRREFKQELYRDFVNSLEAHLKTAIERIAHDTITKKRITTSPS